MLQAHTVDARIPGLIRRIQSMTYMQGFNLAGGTALALYIGHRRSIDIDLFCISSFDEQMLLEQYTLGELLDFYRKKYTLQNDAIVLKSLVWFEDAEPADWPVIIKEPGLSWNKVKKRLIQSVKGL